MKDRSDGKYTNRLTVIFECDNNYTPDNLMCVHRTANWISSSVFSIH